MVKNYSIIAVLSLIMLIALIYGIAESGSPWDTRGRRFDQTRISDLNNIKSAIDNYYATNRVLPTNLTDLKNSNYSYYSINDPETNVQYLYKTTNVNGTSYQLCATFSQKSDNQNLNGNNYHLPPLKRQISDHPKGDYCFSLSVSPTSLYKPSTTYFLTTTASNRDAIRISDLDRLKQMITDGAKKLGSPSAFTKARRFWLYII